MAHLGAEQLAYAAGFFDGEGSCAAYLGAGYNGKGLIYKTSITNTHLPVLEWHKECFGGGILHRTKRQAHHKDAWDWQLTTLKAYLYLEAIFPYLQVKKENVAYMLQIWENRSDKEWRDELMLMRQNTWGRKRVGIPY